MSELLALFIAFTLALIATLFYSNKTTEKSEQAIFLLCCTVLFYCLLTTFVNPESSVLDLYHPPRQVDTIITGL